MTNSFTKFESAMASMCQRLKKAPQQEILLSRLYHHIHMRLVERHEEVLRPHGANITLWTALCVLFSQQNEEPITPSELSTYLDSSRTNVTRVADELIEKGWAERRASTEDRRQFLLSLTPAGEEFVQARLPALRERHKGLWSDFSKTEMETMETLLRKLLKQLDE